MMTLLYDAAIGAYRAGIRLAASFLPKARAFVLGRRDLLPRIETALRDEPRERIWMHCASLGEFEQGRPVLETLRRQHPECAIVLTFFSPSGYEVRKDYAGADYVFYLPEDTRHNAARFVAAVRPRLALLVKYDLWLHLLEALRAAAVPVVLFAALFRERQGFFRWYGAVQRRMLRLLSHVFVQDERSKTLLQTLGIEAVTVAGDPRFDRVAAAAAAPADSLPQLIDFAGTARLVVAGSTWTEDEVLLQEAGALPQGWKLVLVPHEVDAAHLARIESLFPGRIRRWSAEAPVGADILLVDRVGLLLQIYRHAGIAYVGGGFGRAGVHNVLEPAAFGVPVVHGPVYHQFAEAEALLQHGGSVAVQSAGALALALGQWTHNENARRAAGIFGKGYVESGQGATDRICNYLAAKYWLMTL